VKGNKMVFQKGHLIRNTGRTHFKKGHKVGVRFKKGNTIGPRLQKGHKINVGRHRSEITKKKMSDAHRGMTPWNKGQKAPQISEALKGNTPWNKGKTGVYSKETLKKMSEVRKGQAPWCKGLTKETDERVAKMSKALKNNNAAKRPEVRAKIRVARLKQVFPFKDSSIEILIQNELKRRGIIFEKHQPVCGVCQPDIVFPGRRLAVFCDGDYWHNLPEMMRKDQRQETILRENGWRFLRFWEHQINDDVSACVDTIEAMMARMIE